MGRDLSPGPHTRDEIADAVEGVLPGIEIVDSRYTSWTTMGAEALIADNACHGAWVKGALVKDWRGIDLASQPVQLVVNGKVVAVRERRGGAGTSPECARMAGEQARLRMG